MKQRYSNGKGILRTENILSDKPPWDNCADYVVEGKLPEDDGRSVTSHERFVEMVSRRAPYFS